MIVALSSTIEAVSTTVGSQRPVVAVSELVDRFLTPTDEPLTSYRAFRRLTASTRGGRMQATVEVWTTLDPVHGFSFEIVSEDGSALIRRKVLIAALEAEQKAVSSTDGAQAALTKANYEFLGMSPADDDLLRVDVRPHRKHHMRVEGSLLLEPNRDYGRINGVRVPLSMGSTADVLVVGASTFSMTYRYTEINGRPVEDQ
ncbi:MAG: hypothetical protein DMF89_24400 [Acidobacteria bacterium]|nr:MAG: hypothetical protein DMF89_24400 [Acidobacteriota bacterium]